MHCNSIPGMLIFVWWPAQFYQQLSYQEINEQYLWEQRLAPLLTYLPEDHVIKVREALSLAYDAHIKQKRKSGEPFITHPVEVTRILAELQMDFESLIAGIAMSSQHIMYDTCLLQVHSIP